MFLKRYVLFISCIWLFCVGCKPNNSSQDGIVEHEVIELPQGFDEFYERFHVDSVFQKEHIVFPLENHSTNTEVGEYWKKENWVVHSPYDDHGGTFQRAFRAIGTLVVETIVEAKGMFYMERRYAKLADGWHLIYYEVRLPTFDK